MNLLVVYGLHRGFSETFGEHERVMRRLFERFHDHVFEHQVNVLDMFDNVTVHMYLHINQ